VYRVGLPSTRTDRIRAGASGTEGTAMSDDGNGAEPPSTREYLSLVFFNRVSLAGLAVALAGLVALRLFGSTRTRAAVGTVILLAGVGLFIVGFTLAQRRLSRETGWG